MAFFRPRVSREAEVRYHADQEISKSFPELLEKARQAEQTLRELRAAAADEIELLAAGGRSTRRSRRRSGPPRRGSGPRSG